MAEAHLSSLLTVVSHFHFSSVQEEWLIQRGKEQSVCGSARSALAGRAPSPEHMLILILVCSPLITSLGQGLSLQTLFVSVPFCLCMGGAAQSSESSYMHTMFSSTALSYQSWHTHLHLSDHSVSFSIGPKFRTGEQRVWIILTP